MSTPHFCVCGVPDMMVEIEGLSFNLGAFKNHIFTEGGEEDAAVKWSCVGERVLFDESDQQR